MAKAVKKLDQLFHTTLKDIYFAEKKILSTLPKMAKAVHSEELKAAFEKHHGETQGQVERLEQVFATIDKKPEGKACAAIVGITDEGAEIMEEYRGSPALDAGLLAAAALVPLAMKRPAVSENPAAPIRAVRAEAAEPTGCMTWIRSTPEGAAVLVDGNPV